MIINRLGKLTVAHELSKKNASIEESDKNT